MRPRLLRSDFTGNVYIVTKYVDHGDGNFEAQEKYDVTDEFHAIALQSNAQSVSGAVEMVQKALLLEAVETYKVARVVNRLIYGVPDPDSTYYVDDGKVIDLSDCPYFRHSRLGAEYGTCSYGCVEEPVCITSEPEGDWRGVRGETRP